MKNVIVSADKRKRRFLIIAPLIILPFIALMFWAMGGGKKEGDNKVVTSSTGFNTGLPQARLKSDKGFDKMAYYLQAAADSMRLKEREGKDGHTFLAFLAGKDKDNSGEEDSVDAPQELTSLVKKPSPGIFVDPNERRVYERLEVLNKQLSSPSTNQLNKVSQQTNHENSTIGVQGQDVDRLERMLKTVQHSSETPNDEMVEMNKVLDKLLAVQRPDLLKDSAKSINSSTLGSPLPVNIQKMEKTASGFKLVAKAFDTTGKKNSRAFQEYNAFHVSEGEEEDQMERNTIDAEIAENQTVVSGAILKLQLNTDIFIKGVRIVKGTVLAGQCSLNSERLGVDINSIKCGSSIYSVHMKLYDQDGLAGIFIPGAIGRDAAKQAADQGINGIGLTTLDPSIGAQAASAGIQMAKSIASKKVKLVRVSIEAGYRVLLKSDDNLVNKNKMN